MGIKKLVHITLLKNFLITPRASLCTLQPLTHLVLKRNSSTQPYLIQAVASLGTILSTTNVTRKRQYRVRGGWLKAVTKHDKVQPCNSTQRFPTTRATLADLSKDVMAILQSVLWLQICFERDKRQPNSARGSVYKNLLSATENYDGPNAKYDVTIREMCFNAIRSLS